MELGSESRMFKPPNVEGLRPCSLVSRAHAVLPVFNLPKKVLCGGSYNGPIRVTGAGRSRPCSQKKARVQALTGGKAAGESHRVGKGTNSQGGTSESVAWSWTWTPTTCGSSPRTIGLHRCTTLRLGTPR